MGETQNPRAIDEPCQELSEARCQCGQLIAKLGLRGVELKCKRCKRLVSIPFSSLFNSNVTVQLCDKPSA